MLETPTFQFSLDPNLHEYCEEHNQKTGESRKPEDFLPTRVKEQDVAYDLRCAVPEGLVIHPFEYQLIPLGVRMLAPENWWLFQLPRSGTFAKKHIHALYGVIDPNYENYLNFSCQFIPEGYHLKKKNDEVETPLKIEFGDRVAQVIPMPKYSMALGPTLSEDEYNKACVERGWSRGLSGFNGSGNK